MLDRGPPTLRRALAFAFLFAMVASLGLGLLMPFLSAKSSYEQSIEALLHERARYEEVLSQKEPLESRIARFKAQAVRQQAFLVADSDTLAGAMLQETVKGIVQKAGGALESMEIRAVSGDSTLDQIGLRVRFVGTIDVLQRTLHEVESGELLLVVEQLDVRSKASAVRDDPTQPVEIAISLDLYGYRQARAL